jgi:hypothetical protein
MISLLGSLLNLKGLEESRYTLLGSQGPFEIRLYQRMAVAKVMVQGDFNQAFQQGKKHLLDYLQGSNLRLEKIETSSLFFQTERQNAWEVGVILNSIRVNSEIPKPINRLVRLEEISPGKVATLKCNGVTSQEIFSERKNQLMKWLNLKSYSVNGPARIFHHSSSMPIPFLRDKEVMIDIN